MLPYDGKRMKLYFTPDCFELYFRNDTLNQNFTSLAIGEAIQYFLFFTSMISLILLCINRLNLDCFFMCLLWFPYDFIM
jgi:hypothetical protein